MDLNYLIKNYWHLITAIITVIFVIGIYYAKIQYLEDKVLKNSTDIESIKKDTYIIIGILQKDYPNININEFAKTAQSKNLSIQETYEDLNKLKEFSPNQGKTYLMEKGFSKDQIEAIYYKSNH